MDSKFWDLGRKPTPTDGRWFVVALVVLSLIYVGIAWSPWAGAILFAFLVVFILAVFNPRTLELTNEIEKQPRPHQTLDVAPFARTPRLYRLLAFALAIAVLLAWWWYLAGRA